MFVRVDGGAAQGHGMAGVVVTPVRKTEEQCARDNIGSIWCVVFSAPRLGRQGAAISSSEFQGSG